MSNTFGIKQSFRSQAIARKFARTPSSSSPSPSPSDLSSNQTKVKQNVFESGNNNFASNVLNRRNTLNDNVKISSLDSVNKSNLNNTSSSLTDLNSSNELNDKTDYRRAVSARLLHMKNYNKAVTRSADHM